MATALAQLSASVTRILSLTGFPKELKTRDIQAAFADFDSQPGGFKIKWIDDTSLLIVFNDPTVAKRAYLSTLANPPAVFTSPTADTSATIRPYDGPDAQQIIAQVNARGNGNARRQNSIAIPNNKPRGPASALSVDTPAAAAGASAAGNGREGSPTLPSLPSHPTLDSLISSTLEGANDPAIVAALPASNGARIGDPGKRMIAAGLGVRHPSLGARPVGTVAE